jgi:O-antigen ligase
LILLVVIPVYAATVATGSRAVALFALGVYALGLLFATVLDVRSVALCILLILPLVTIEVGFGNTDHTLSSDKIALVIAAGAWWLRRGFRRELFSAFIPPVRWLTGFCLVVALGAAFRGFAFRQLWALGEQLVALSIFLLALDAFRAEETRRAAFRYLLWGSAVVSGVTLAQVLANGLTGVAVALFFKSGTMLDEFRLRDMPSTLGHANSLGSYVALALPTAVVAIVMRRGTEPRAIWAVLLLQSGAVLVAESIGTFAALVVVLILALFWLWRWLGFRERAFLGSLIAGAVGVGGLLLFWFPYSLGDRLEYYRLGLRMFLEHPLAGWGAGGFSRAYAEYVPTPLYKPIWNVGAHSSFLEVLVNWGIPGLVFFVGALCAVLRDGGAGIRKVPRGPMIPQAVGLWLGLLAFVLNAGSENLFSFSKLTAVFWTLAALLLHLTVEKHPEAVVPHL